MSRQRRRRVKIKSSSRLFAFILFNLLLLASCVTAHYLEDQHLEHLPLTEAHRQQPAGGIGGTYLPPANKYAEQNFDLPTLVGGSATSHQQQPHRVEGAAAPTILSNYQSSQQQTFDSATNLDAQLQPTEVSNYFQQAQQHTIQNPRLREQSPQQQQQPNNQQAVVASSLPSVQSLCAQLPAASARHLKLCKLTSDSPQADEAVALGAARGLAECRNQFRNEKWNCTHTGGEHHLLTSRFAQSLGNREAAFVQAIAAAGIVHSIATACSVGSLSDCACDKSRVGLVRQRDKTFKWGGCSNNIRHGMMFARHLVELLDAVHEQQQLQHHHQMQRSLSQNSGIQQQREQYKSHHRHHRPLPSPHHQMSKRQVSANSSRQQPVAAGPNQFCQKNQNISQTTHLQLIKSLLAKNSLERHQDFRLAMNIHNNKVGRMAVANNMERVCRCHGLSGSCSLETCWLKLPDFQRVGDYLRRKYEVSVHLPVAVDVNKLIPMMDRQELSAILQLQAGGGVGASDSLQEEQALSAGTTIQPAAGAGTENSLAAAVSSGGRPEYAALTRPLDEHATPTSPTFPLLSHGEANGQPPVHFGYYERHRLLEQRQRAAGQQPATVGEKQIGGRAGGNSTKLYLHGETEPIPVEPMSQQQYQALLRDTRLCSAVMNSSSSSSHTVNTRDLSNFDATTSGVQSRLPVASAQRKSAQVSNLIQYPPAATSTPGGRQQFKFTSAHLSHLLQAQAAREDLIHLHNSPEYCKADQRHGYAGVTGRVCSLDKGAANSCDKLCCKNGFEQRVTQLKTACKCEFYFCCKIQCKMCEETRVEYVCK